MVGRAMEAGIPGRESATKIMHGVLAVLIAMSVTVSSSAADERDHRRGAERGRHEGWHGQVHRFNEHDLGRWRAGSWHRGRHAGRLGWWWIVGGVWYYYPAPVYPYPNPYLPPSVIIPLAPAPAPGSTQQYWYYCTNPPGYYPTVPACRTGWQRVPASAPAGVARQ